MSFLSDTDIERFLCQTAEWDDKSKLHIYPFEDKCLTPVGYDLRVGRDVSVPTIRNGDPTQISEDTEISVLPGDLCRISTLETVGMPKTKELSGLVMSKVSKVSKGFSGVSTTIDADWDGRLLITIRNCSTKELTLKYGEPFCTAVFFHNLSPATRSCMKEPGRNDYLITKLAHAEREAEEQQRQKRKKRELIITFLSILFLAAFYIAAIIVYAIHPKDLNVALGLGLLGTTLFAALMPFRGSFNGGGENGKD